MRDLCRRWSGLAVALACACALGCRSAGEATRPASEPPPGLKPTVIDYVDTEAFDAYFETALVNQDPVILIQTEMTRPYWGPRLNAWIAAWNRGGARPGPGDDRPAPRVRLQAPLSPPAVNGETLREFRLLIDDLMTRVEDLARRGSTWWAEERTQKRRIALLRPYSLRFHLDEGEGIQLIFFHGDYAQYYREFTQSLAAAEADGPEGWARVIKCSRCKGRRLSADGALGSAPRPGERGASAP
jgi:hypothetical protein